MRLHLIEKDQRLKVVDLKERIWDSGHWKFSEEFLNELIGGEIYLHHKQADPAHQGGIVISYRPTDDPEFKDQGRYIIRFQMEPSFRGVRPGRDGWSYHYKIVR